MSWPTWTQSRCTQSISHFRYFFHVLWVIFQTFAALYWKHKENFNYLFATEMTSKYGKPNAIKLLMLTPPLSEANSVPIKLSNWAYH